MNSLYSTENFEKYYFERRERKRMVLPIGVAFFGLCLILGWIVGATFAVGFTLFLMGALFLVFMTFALLPRLVIDSKGIWCNRRICRWEQVARIGTFRIFHDRLLFLAIWDEAEKLHLLQLTNWRGQPRYAGQGTPLSVLAAIATVCNKPMSELSDAEKEKICKKPLYRHFRAAILYFLLVFIWFFGIFGAPAWDIFSRALR